MSFGFGIGDIIACTEIAVKTIDALRSAGPEFEGLRLEVSSLTSVLGALEAEARGPMPLIHSAPRDRQEQMGYLLDNCKSGMKDLQDLVARYGSMGGTKKRDFVQWMRFAARDKRSPREKLAIHTASINIFLTTLSHGSLARLEFLIKNGRQECSRVATASMGQREINLWSTNVSDVKQPASSAWKSIIECLAEEGIEDEQVDKFQEEVKAYVRYLVRGETPFWKHNRLRGEQAAPAETTTSPVFDEPKVEKEKKRNRLLSELERARQMVQPPPMHSPMWASAYQPSAESPPIDPVLPFVYDGPMLLGEPGEDEDSGPLLSFEPVSPELPVASKSQSSKPSRGASGIITIEDVNSDDEYVGGTTRFPVSLLSRRAVIDLGYSFIEEESHLVVSEALSQTDIDKLLELSGEYERVEAEIKRRDHSEREVVKPERLSTGVEQSEENREPRLETELRIWEAARAKSAVPGFFKPLEPGKPENKQGGVARTDEERIKAAVGKLVRETEDISEQAKVERDETKPGDIIRQPLRSRRSRPLSPAKREKVTTMRKMSACDSCRRRRTRCEPQHLGLMWEEEAIARVALERARAKTERSQPRARSRDRVRMEQSLEAPLPPHPLPSAEPAGQSVRRVSSGDNANRQVRGSGKPALYERKESIEAVKFGAPTSAILGSNDREEPTEEVSEAEDNARSYSSDSTGRSQSRWTDVEEDSPAEWRRKQEVEEEEMLSLLEQFENLFELDENSGCSARRPY